MEKKNIQNVVLLALSLFWIDCSQAIQNSQGFKKVDFSDGNCISKELYAAIVKLLPEGGTILEFGSGWGSGKLSELYTVYSVEHDNKWLNKYETNYIHAPIKNGWYDTAILQKALPMKYDLILVDGPPRTIGRWGFYENLALFNINVPIILDDVHRKDEWDMMLVVADKLGRVPEIIESHNKKFAILSN